MGEALGWVREQGLSVENELSYLHEFDTITLARILIARYKNEQVVGSIHEALRLLERLLQAAQAGGRMGSVIEILVLQALAYHAQADLPAARLPLQSALALAGPEGYVRIFVDEGEPMRLLIADFRLQFEKRPGHAAGEDMEELKAYTAQLLAAFSKSPDALVPKSTIQNLKSKILPEPLSQRELKIIQLIAQGLSN